MISNAQLPEDDWNDATAALNYARFRPTYAPLAATWARDFYRSVSGRERAAVAIDAGCGPGLLSVPLADFCDRVFAIDAARKVLDVARWLAPRPNVTYLYGDVRALRSAYSITRAPPADLLVTGMAAHYVDFDSENFYNNARSVLRQGGVVAHFGYHHPGFSDPGTENLLDDFFDRVVIGERKENFSKLKAGYQSLFFPYSESQSRSEEVILRMAREDVKKLLLSYKPALEDADRNVEEFVTEVLPTGDSFGMKLKIFGRMAEIR